MTELPTSNWTTNKIKSKPNNPQSLRSELLRTAADNVRGNAHQQWAKPAQHSPRNALQATNPGQINCRQTQPYGKVYVT